MAITEQTIFYSSVTGMTYDIRVEAERAEEKELLIQQLESDAGLTRFFAKRAVEYLQRHYTLTWKEL